MFLAFLGMEGERIDVGAHIAGFLAGCPLGAGLIVIRQHAVIQQRRAQNTFGAAALLLFAGAWLIALSGGGVPQN